MDAGQDNGTFAKIEGVLRSAAWVGQIPAYYWLCDFLSPILNILGINLGIQARHGALRKFASEEIDGRKARGSDHGDILDKLLNVQKAKPNEMNDMSVLSMATSNVFAGSDTTAISARSVIYYLLKNPKYKQRLIEEIDAYEGDGRLTEPITLEQAKHMPYLQACLYEGLRCHPAVGMSLPRVTPPGGIKIDGRYIPQGVGSSELLVSKLILLQTVVGVNPWVVHRDTAVFGEDVESFNPERWLGDIGEMGTTPPLN